MGNSSFGGVFRLLACLGLLMLSARVAPVLAGTTAGGKSPAHTSATHPYKPAAAPVVVRVAIVGGSLFSHHALYLRAVASIEHFHLCTGEGRYEEQDWPFPLPIAVSYLEGFEPIRPDYVFYQPAPVAADKVRPAAITKHTQLLRRYAAGQFT